MTWLMNILDSSEKDALDMTIMQIKNTHTHIYIYSHSCCDRWLKTTASKGWLLMKCIFEFWQWPPSASENKADLGNLYLWRQCSCTKYEGCIRPCDSCQQLLHWKKHKREGKKIPSKNDDTKESLALCLVLFFESHFVETQPKLMKSLFCFLFEISFRFCVFPTQFSGHF